MTRNCEGFRYSFTKKHGDRPSEDRSSDSVVSSKTQALFICPHGHPQCTGVLSRACHLIVGKTTATTLGTISPHKIGEEDRGWEICSCIFLCITEEHISFLSFWSEVGRVLTCRPIIGQEQWGFPDWFQVDHCSSPGTGKWPHEQHQGSVTKEDRRNSCGGLTVTATNKDLSSQWMARPHAQDAQLLSLLVQTQKECIDAHFEPAKKFSLRGRHSNIV